MLASRATRRGAAALHAAPCPAGRTLGVGARTRCRARTRANAVRLLASSSSPALPEAVTLSAQELPSMRDESYAEAPRLPLIVLHGLLGSLSNFRRIAAHPQLGKNRRVVVADLRNHGSSPHSEDVSLEAMSADILRLMDDRDMESAVVLGHSLGGRVAMTAGLLHPDRVRELVVVDMAPVVYPREFTYRPRWDSIPRIMDAMAGLDLAAIESREDADAALRDAIPDKGVRAFVLQNLQADRSTKPPAWSWRLGLDSLRAGLDSMFSFEAAAHGPYPNRALFLSGGKSKYVTEEHHPEISRLFPQAELRSIPKAGHWVHAEKPADFVREVGEFLSRE